MDVKMMGSTYVIASPGRVRGTPGEAQGAIFPLRGQSGESTGKPRELIVQCGGGPGNARGSPEGYHIHSGSVSDP